MATADELLMTTNESAEEILVVDLNARVIGIPANLRILGVESDDDVKRLQFKIPRHYGEFDLSNFDIRINFENARGKGDVYPVEDMIVSDADVITFSWLVDRIAFDYPGDVKFSICMKLYNGDVVVKELNTTYATLAVLEGLETERAVVDQNPSAFDHVMCRLYAVEAATGNGKNGYYSVVKVDQRIDGTVFTIVNQDGETIAYVRHGIDGHTPVKGTDYWTEQDKLEVEEHAKSYVEGWAPIYTTAMLNATGWSNNNQTVPVEGVTTDSVVFVSPDPTYNNSYVEYAMYTVRCSSQGTSVLTFECNATPPNDIKVNIAVYKHAKNSGSGSDIIVTDDGNGNVTIM